MKIVKVTFNYDWPLFRQTSGYSQIWGDYKFVIDDNVKECDFWLIYSDYNLKEEGVRCAPENVIFIPGECYNTSSRFNQPFLDQFGLILTMQRELKHRNIIYTHNANPWFVGKSYDELNNHDVPEKTKLISVITSNKSFTEGHKKRLDFVMRLKEHFGDQLDLYGRGIKAFDDKWDVVAPYKYTIAIENDFCDDWVTEKYFDCVYANTLPFYYGCPNLEDIVDEKSFIRIDINEFDTSVKIIEKAVKEATYESRITDLTRQKLKSLNEDQFFPWIVSILDQQHANTTKKLVRLKGNVVPDTLGVRRLKKKLRAIKKMKLTKVIKRILSLGKKRVLTDEEIQYNRCLPWFAVKGDETLRLDYDLNEDAVVFDLGGYKGEFAAKIYEKYQSHIHVFEPVPSFYNTIRDTFNDNDKVIAYPYGLAANDGELQISLTEDASSVFVQSDESQTIQLKSITDFIKIHQITTIDLIKINIEGGEYEVLESLLAHDFIKNIKNIQVQFHDFIVENAAERMKKIQDELSKTHKLTYQYEFVWENWERKA